MTIAGLLFSLRGRINRSQFWAAYIPIVVCNFAVWVLTLALHRAHSPAADIVVPSSYLAYLALTWMSFTLYVKRLHDRDRSAFFLLWYLLPIVGALWIMIEVWFLPGTPGPNRFSIDDVALDASGSKALAIAKREVSGLFFSLVGYIVLAVYLFWMGFLFALAVLVPGERADMRIMFNYSHLGLIFVVPLMTMSMFADEYASGRIEMLRTSPITEFDILIGKFLGAMTFYAAVLGSTLVYVLLLMIYGRPNYGAVLAGYFGLLLLGAMTVPIGLFFSSITRHQIVACILGIITILTLVLLGEAYRIMLATNASLGWSWLTVAVRETLNYLSFFSHMEAFAKGVVQIRDVFYFLSGGGLFLLLTYLVLESRKWR